jgi:hypothetical protein
MIVAVAAIALGCDSNATNPQRAVSAKDQEDPLN